MTGTTKPTPDTESNENRPEPASGPASRRHAELLDESEHLRRSLDDLDRELAAGDLDAVDYESLRERYEERSVAVDAALDEVTAAESGEALEPNGTRAVGAGAVGAGAVRAGAIGAGAGAVRTGAVGPGTVAVGAGAVRTEAVGVRAVGARHGSARAWLATRRHRMVLGWSAAGCFALAGVLLGLSLAGVAPFASSSQPQLSLNDQIRIELGEAGVLASNKELVQAVAVYDRVLELDPEQPEALANGGWLARLAGLSSKSQRVVIGADAEIAAAVKVAPSYALARAYDGVALYQDAHAAPAAVRQFRAMLADKPSTTVVDSVRTTALAAYHSAAMPVPAALAAPPPSTSPPTSG